MVTTHIGPRRARPPERAPGAAVRLPPRSCVCAPAATQCAGPAAASALALLPTPEAPFHSQAASLGWRCQAPTSVRHAASRGPPYTRVWRGRSTLAAALQSVAASRHDHRRHLCLLCKALPGAREGSSELPFPGHGVPLAMLPGAPRCQPTQPQGCAQTAAAGSTGGAAARGAGCAGGAAAAGQAARQTAPVERQGWRVRGALRARAGQACRMGGAWHHAGGRRGTNWPLPAISCTARASRHTRQRGAPCALPAETGGEHANAAAQGSRQCHGAAVAANPLCSAQPARSRW